MQSHGGEDLLEPRPIVNRVWLPLAAGRGIERDLVTAAGGCEGRQLVTALSRYQSRGAVDVHSDAVITAATHSSGVESPSGREVVDRNSSPLRAASSSTS